MTMQIRASPQMIHFQQRWI